MSRRGPPLGGKCVNFHPFHQQGAPRAPSAFEALMSKKTKQAKRAAAAQAKTNTRAQRPDPPRPSFCSAWTRPRSRTRRISRRLKLSWRSRQPT